MSSPIQWGNSTAHIIELSGLVHILTVFIFPGEGSGTPLTVTDLWWVLHPLRDFCEVMIPWGPT